LGVVPRGRHLLRLRSLLLGAGSTFLLLSIGTRPHGDGAGQWIVEGRPRSAALVAALAPIPGLATVAGRGALSTGGSSRLRGRRRFRRRGG